MTDTGTAAAEPITLEAFDPPSLLMDANARSNAEATVDKAFVAELKAYAGPPLKDSPRGAGTTPRSSCAAARTGSCGSAPGTAAPSAASAPACRCSDSSPATRATSAPTW